MSTCIAPSHSTGKIYPRKKLNLQFQARFNERSTLRLSPAIGSLVFAFFLSPLFVLSQRIETVVQKGHELAVLDVVVSPDSSYAVSTSKDKSAKLWDLKTGREVRSFLGHEASVTAAALSSDGQTLLTGSNDKTIRLWNVRTAEELHVIEGLNYITAVAIDPRMRFFASAGYNDTGRGDSIAIYDWATKKLITRIPTNPDKGLGKGVSLSVSSDGKFLAAGEDNRSLILYETQSWTSVQKLEYTEGFCGGCGTFSVFDPQGGKLYSASHNGLFRRYDLERRVFDLQYGDEVDEVTDLALSPDGKYVALSSEAQLLVYDAALGTLLASLSAEEKAGFNRVAFSLDGSELLIATNGNVVLSWAFLSQRMSAPLAGFLAYQDQGNLDYDPNFYWQSHIARYLRFKNSLLLFPDAGSLLGGRFGKNVRRWDIASGKAIMEFAGHKKAVLAYALSGDGKRLVTGGGDGKIIVWDVNSGDSLTVIHGHREPVFDIRFNSAEDQILSTSWDGTMKIHQAQNGKLSSYVSLDNSSAYTALYHPNDLYVFTARLDNSLQLWEIDTRTPVRSFVGHTGIVSALAVTRDQKLLMSASWDGSIRLWDISSGLMVRKIRHSKTAVHSAILSKDDRLLISAGADRMIRIWDIASGKLLRELSGHNAEVSCVILSQDENMLISRSVDGVTKFWNLDSYAEFFEHFHLGDRDWLVKNKDGYFYGTDGARKFIHFVDGMKTFNVDQFFHDFYRPELLPKIFKNRGAVDQSQGIEKKIRNSAPPDVKAAVLPLEGGRAELHVRMTNTGTGVQKLRILHNEKSVSLQDATVPYPRTKGERTTFKIELPLISGNNAFTVSAINADNVESDPRIVELFTDSGAKHGLCHILAIGINEYENPKLSLSYAKPDAVSFAETLNQKASSLFGEVRVHSLFDKEADRAGIISKLDALSGEVQPEDVFILYYAGHGSMVENKFYFIPTDNRRLYDESGLRKEAIEAGVIQQKLKNIKALKQLIIMDACQSGGSVELLATRGANEEKAIAQLSRSSGVHVLASAGSEQFAAEFAELGHGLFTYVLLKALQGEADGAPRDGKVTIFELKSYIDDQVPEMSRKLKGKPQYPYTFSRGQDFPVVIRP